MLGTAEELCATRQVLTKWLDKRVHKIKDHLLLNSEDISATVRCDSPIQ